MSSYSLDVEPLGKCIRCRADQTILEACQQAGISLRADCGSVGVCAKCQIILRRGHFSPESRSEQDARHKGLLTEERRLACQCYALSDGKIEVPPETQTQAPKLQTDARGLQAGTMTQPITGSAAQPGHIGLAVDMGTTKVAAYLMDLQSGAVLAQTARMNPQISFGEDIISRIAAANQSPETAKQLQTVLVACIQAMADELCKQMGLQPNQISQTVMVGNTAIHHFLLGLPVKQLGEAPYVPAEHNAKLTPARDLGFTFAPEASVYTPPVIAGFVGSDHLAALLPVLQDEAETKVLIDIGTNTEVSLITPQGMFSCSTASGPAFEGAHIHDGMRASAGAIDAVSIENGVATVHTIADAPPIGICGTGILSAVQALLQTGLLDRRGRFVAAKSSGSPGDAGKDRGHSGVIPWGKSRAYVLVEAGKSGSGQEILVTQKDVHEILLAKAAIRTGIDILLDRSGYKPGGLSKWFIAGAFGTYLNLQDAMQIGMLPKVDSEAVSQIGNAAGWGARQLLLSQDDRRYIEQVPGRVQYIELMLYPQFQERYIQNLFLTGEA